MKKSRLILYALFLILIISFSATANAFSLINWLKELYGVQPSGEGEYVPVEEIKVEESKNITELPPTPPEEGIPSVEEITKEPEEIVEVTEKPEEKEETPEKVVEEPKKEAKAIIVKETDMVSLKPQASDPDKDKLSFSYTTPLDKEGKWQTTYGNAGEYKITITASDGQLSTTKDVLLIVNKKEEPPVIDESIPKEEALTAKENSKLEFSVKASDLNKDPLKYSWKLDGNDVSTTNSYTHNIGYDAAGQHTVKISVSDGAKEASKIWSLKVENVNRKPVLDKILDIKVKENQVIVLEPKATDPDNDKLTYSADSSKFKKVSDNRFEWKTTYDDSGAYTVTVAVSDGTDYASQVVNIEVENVNRPPVIEDITLG